MARCSERKNKTDTTTKSAVDRLSHPDANRRGNKGSKTNVQKGAFCDEEVVAIISNSSTSHRPTVEAIPEGLSIIINSISSTIHKSIAEANSEVFSIIIMASTTSGNNTTIIGDAHEVSSEGPFRCSTIEANNQGTASCSASTPSRLATSLEGACATCAAASEGIAQHIKQLIRRRDRRGVR